MRWPALALAMLAACNDGGATGSGDGGSSGIDTGVAVDAGVRALCPAESNPACTMASACGTADTNPPTNCKGCIPFNRAMCVLGRCVRSEPDTNQSCEAPDCNRPLTAGDPVNFLFQVGSLQGRLQSFAGVALTVESAGGQAWSCEDVYAGRLDLANKCHNVLDTRGQDIARPENQYTMTFTRFPSGQRTLFVVYGFAMAESMGSPIGVSCAVADVGGPGSRLMMIPGDTMRPL